MAKRINKNKITLRKRQMRTHSKFNSNSPNSKNQNKGSAKTSTPSSVRGKTTTNNGKRNNVTKTVNNANKALNKTIDNLFKPKQVTTNNPKKTVSKNAYRVAANKGTLDKFYKSKGSPLDPNEIREVRHGFTYAAGAEVKRQLTTGKMSKEHGEMMNKLGQIMSKHLSSDEYVTWYRNLEETGDLVLPSKVPVTLNDEEKKVWNYYSKYKLYYDREVVKVQEAKEKQEERAYHTADYNDYSMGTTNSYFDIARSYMNTYLSGDAHTAGKNFIKDIKEYHKRYIFHPLRKGQFGVLANNILVNLGETMDMLATAPKALMKESGKTVYGTGNRFMEGQDYWVYDKDKKDIQKQMVELGAMDLITYGDERMQRGKSTHDPEAIKRRLKQAGLWEEYKKFKSAYLGADLGGDPLKEVVHAYTSHDNYNVDTGYLGFDLLTETVVDPSFMVGGFAKSFSSAGAKAITRKGVKEGLEAAVKEGGPLLKELEDVLKESEDVARKYYKLMDESLFSVKTRDATLDTNVKNMATLLESKGMLKEEHKAIFINNTLAAIKGDMDSRHFRLIQGVKALDDSLNAVDSMALKSVFAAPYLGYKGIKLGQKTANQFALKRAVSRVKEGLVDENGHLSIANLEEVITRADNEFISGNKALREELDNEIMELISKHHASNSADLIKLKDRLLKVDDIKEVDLSVRIYIARITNGRFSDVSSFMKHLEEIKVEQFGKYNRAVHACNDYLADLRTILDHRYNLVQSQVKEYYKRLKDIKTEEDFIALYTEAQAKRGVLPDDFYISLDVINKEFNEEAIAQMVRNYEVKYNTTLKESSSKIKDFKNINRPYDETELILQGQMTEKVKKALNGLPGIRFGKKEIPGAYKGMRKFLKEIRTNSNNVDLRDFIEMHQAFSTAFVFRDAQGVVTKQERYFKERLDSIAMSVTKEDLSTTVGKDAQFVQMQVDKLAVMDRFLSDTNLKNDIFELLSPNTPVGKVIRTVSKKVEEWSAIDESVGIKDFSKKCSNLLEEVEVAKAVIELRDKLSPLPDRERWAVLESLFGVSKGAPEDYVRMNSFKRKEFIEKVELWLNANYGISTVSLDGFSKQARNFDSDFYKPYQEELKDIKLQQRIDNFLKGGHLNPVKDVQKQMFQIILKDPDSVKAYNGMAKRKDVFFTDIETQGFNTGLHEITSIATKKWVEIPEGASLKEILDILEDDSTEILHKATYDKEYLKNNISDELLEAIFKNDKTIVPTREARLEKYIEVYGVKDGEELVSEQDVLTEFMVRLDESNATYNDVPTLVVHNNNGFDLNYIQSRCTTHKIFPQGIPHIRHILDNAENTIMRLKGLEDDVILSNESMNLIIESVEQFMGKVKGKGSMRLFSEAKINEGLKMLDFEVGKRCDSWNENSSTVGSIKKAYKSGELSKIRESFTETSNVIKEEMAIYKNHIIANPHRIRLQNLDESEWAKYFTEDEIDSIMEDYLNLDSYNEELLKRYFEMNYNYTPGQINNLMRTIKELNDTAHSPLGYRVLFDDADVSRYFGYGSDVLLSDVQLRGMQSFTESIAKTVNRRMKSNPYIADYFDDYKTLINYIKVYAQDLDAWDEFSFLQYIKEPTSVNEAYAMAQHLWDSLYTPMELEDIIKLETEDYNKLKNTERLKIKYQAAFGDNFDLSSIISEDAFKLFTDENSMYHQHIFKDATKPYITMYMTDIYKDNTAYQNLMKEFAWGRVTYEEVAAWNEKSGYANILDRVYLQSHTDYSNFIGYLDQVFDTSPDQVEVLLKQAADEMSKRRDLMSCNILENLIKSEHDLLAHLVHHNQFLNIPLEGSIKYEKLVQELLHKLRTEYLTDKLVFLQQDGFLHIGLSKDCVLEKVVKLDKKGKPIPQAKNEPPVYKFKGDEAEYSIPKYERIVMDLDSVFGDNRVAKDLYAKLEESMFRLTEGKSAGSVGTLHTYSKQLEMYEMLPKAFVDNCMTRAHTCDSKLWHGASFDLTNLGDSEHCWKYGKTNDIDPFIAMKETIEEFANRVQSERFLLDSIFNSNSDLTIKNMFGVLDVEEKLDVIQRMTDYTCVVLKEAKTSSGYAVREVSVTDAKALALAEEAHAVFISYDDFILLEEMFNKEEINNVALKVITKYFAYLKNSMLMFTGTWIRNWVDATIKTAGDTGSVSETIKYQMTAAALMRDYNKVIKHFDKVKNMSYMNMTTIQREFDSIPGIEISFEQFQFLEGWFKSSVSGGQSSLVKAMLKNSKGNRNTALKQGHTKTFTDRKNTLKQADTVASEIERFQDLPYEEIVSLCDQLPFSVFRQYNLSKERFLEGFINLDSLTDSEYLAWNKIASELIQVRSKRLVHHSIFSVGTKTIDSFFGAMMTPMSRIEEMVRLGEYLALDAQGYKRGDIFRKITDTHFNYDLKTNRTKMLEWVIPMLTYEKCNALYWVKQIDENPRMLRYLEHFWGELSWSNDEMSSEERVGNEYFRGLLQSGNIPLGNSGLYLKANPSFMSAFDLIAGGPDTYISKLSLPLQFVSKTLLKYSGADSHALLSELDLSKGFKAEDFLDLVPVVGAIYDKFDKGLTYFDDEATYLKLKEYAQHGWQGALVRMLPTVFGAATRWENYTKLEMLEGETWEDYCRRVKVKKGLVWDNNQRKFVLPDEVIPGMLNDPDLSWEETNYYNFILFGTAYDSNQKKWANLEDLYISGGLNSNDNTWDELVILKYIMHGEMWDYNQKKWVQVTEPSIDIRPIKDKTVSADNIVRGDKESILSKLGIISPVYADTLLDNALVKSDAPLKNKKGQYILTGDAEHDNKVFELMKSEVKVPDNKTNSYMRYHNGNAGGYKYSGVNYLPRPKSHSISKKYLGVVNSGGRAYGRSSNRTAGLRMAVSKYTSYDVYYNYEYSYSYNYRNTIKGVADYPQTKLGIDRYMRMRGDNLINNFQNKNNYDLSNSHSVKGLPVSQRLDRSKLYWWMR